MEILEEMELDFSTDISEIKTNLILASKFMGVIGIAQNKREKLKEQFLQVQDWFQKQYDAIDKQEEYARKSIELALYSMKEAGEKKPKINTWAGMAFLQTRMKTDWGNYSNKSQELISFAKKKSIPVKIVESVSLNDIKANLTEEEMKELGIEQFPDTSVTIKLNKSENP